MSKPRMRTTIKRSLQYWTVLLLGLLYISTKCDARAVNVSNSWTMPQEGLNVFYRFFRDRISWFEADAVCQFHHANLVTANIVSFGKVLAALELVAPISVVAGAADYGGDVDVWVTAEAVAVNLAVHSRGWKRLFFCAVVDNSFQFDATRDLLRELDVNDIVWIGLMRPQSSDRFMWSNSRALAANTGYWAESLPLMESPLCAVIDPIRDYRWHALRCGGPETASFLCEMPVPSWAETCILKDLPSLTMQYMADTASIELIRNCGGEGLIRQMCRGKQDRERIMRELICPRERLESKKLSDVTNPHYKSLQIIRGISTDNNENNDIEMVPMKPAEVTEQLQTEKNTVQKLIEQFNVDELMQADQPGSRIPGEIPKPVKKSAKKIVVAIQQKKPTAAPKKSSSSRGHHRDQELADLMMGDQPIPDDASNEIMEPLPHIKKVLPQDLKPMPTMKSTTQIDVSTSTTSTVAVAAIDETSTTIPVTSSELSALAIGTAFELAATSGLTTTSGPSIATTTTGGIVPATQTATIGHPMHPQQQRSNIITEEANHPHVKETNDNHFIPPMLLVKSHYVPPPKGHPDHQFHSPSHDITGITSVREEDESTEATVEHFHHEQSGVLHQTTMSTSRAGETIPPQSATEPEKSARIEAKEQQQQHHQQEATTNSSEIQLQATTTARNEMTTQDGPLAVIHTSSTLKSDTTPEMVATATTTFPTERVTESVITTIGSGRDVTTQSVPSTTTTATTLPSTTTELMPSSTDPIRAVDTQTEEPNKRVTEKTTTTIIDLQSTPSAGNIGGDGGGGDSLTPSFPTDPSTEGPEVISTTTATTTKAQEQPAAPHPTRNFLNEETYPPFKPNRRRSLTKPDTPSYFKKILG